MLEHNRIGIEESKYFFCILTENYLEDPEALECLLYAKNLGKPFVILRDKNKYDILPDVFRGANIKIHEACDFNGNYRGSLEKVVDLLEKEAESHDE